MYLLDWIGLGWNGSNCKLVERTRRETAPFCSVSEMTQIVRFASSAMLSPFSFSLFCSLFMFYTIHDGPGHHL